MSVSINSEKTAAANLLRSWQESVPDSELKAHIRRADEQLTPLVAPLVTTAKTLYPSLLDEYDAAIGTLPLGSFNAVVSRIESRVSPLRAATSSERQQPLYLIVIDWCLIQWISCSLVALIYYDNKDADVFLFSAMKSFDKQHLFEMNTDALALQRVVRDDKSGLSTVFEYAGRALGSFVIGHELGHLIRRHAGSTRPTRRTILGGAELMAELAFQHKQEFEADTIGLSLAQSVMQGVFSSTGSFASELSKFNLGLGVELLLGGMSWWEVINIDDLVLSSHPPACERLARLRALLPRQYSAELPTDLIARVRAKFESLAAFTEYTIKTRSRWIW